ncbi:short-chain dehydrogenase [Caldovatus sediminis]|uniref:Short-chain dehydrogenase n=1 Tax=Caldovatus sediminis TaxID=2041189 RepID=A0A8J2ZDR8_9PROT|nr:SDR family oxidoreductase [Caldovatus sediminis]GGG41782.1 short-chain dehydrogenase [Caldovatus sediminis]
MEDGRTATLVTGATRGIGRAIVGRLLARGEAVIGVARNADPSFPAPLFTADLADAAATAAMLAALTARHRVTRLVNNAGLSEIQPLGEVALDAFDRVVAVNARAALQCAQAVLPAMEAAGAGRIVNIASRSLLGRPGATSYAGAKAALVGFTRTWALELAARNITVNCVAPGPVETAMFRRDNPPDAPHTRALLAAVPMGRMGRPEEVAAAVDYFLSDDAAFTTGQTLFVCGGASAGQLHL